MTAAAVLVLRQKDLNSCVPYRTLGYTVVPLLFVVGAENILFSTAFERPRESAISLGLMALGFLFTVVQREGRIMA